MVSDQLPWRERSPLERAKRLWRTRKPQTFTEKVHYKMLRDHRTLVVTFADKAAVRDHVRSVVGESYLPKAYAIFDSASQLREFELPEACVIKPTHGSGAVIVISPEAPADAILPTREKAWVYRHVTRDAVAPEALAAVADCWLSEQYGGGPNREWAYSRVPRGIIIEELLIGANGGIPEDYKFFVFHGKCQYIQVDAGRFGGRTQDFYSPSWQHLPLSGGPAWAEPPRQRPARLDEMISVAEKLGSSTDFVRVDLYHLGDRVVVGELTNYPAAGNSPFYPQSFNAEFGSHWTVPRRY